jgi:dUTPase
MEKKLGDLQATIAELRKLGAFTEEDLSFLSQVESTFDEFKEEVGAGLTVKLKNHSTNPDPKLHQGMISLYANIDKTEYIQPKAFIDVSTGIEIIELPDHVNLFIEPHTNQYGVFSTRFHHDTLGGNIVVNLMNFTNDPVEIYPGQLIARAFLQTTLNEKFISILTIE